MPLFGFRTHKKYDKDFSQEKQVKPAAESSKKTRPAKDLVITKEQAVSNIKSPVISIPSGISSNAAEAIIRPHVTEKSGTMSQNGAYTFQVGKNANKHTVARAVAALYKVHPVKIAMINSPAKNVFLRGRKGRVPGVRKAIITVKKGEKIDFV